MPISDTSKRGLEKLTRLLGILLLLSGRVWNQNHMFWLTTEPMFLTTSIYRLLLIIRSIKLDDRKVVR